MPSSSSSSDTEEEAALIAQVVAAKLATGKLAQGREDAAAEQEADGKQVLFSDPSKASLGRGSTDMTSEGFDEMAAARQTITQLTDQLAEAKALLADYDPQRAPMRPNTFEPYRSNLVLRQNRNAHQRAARAVGTKRGR